MGSVNNANSAIDAFSDDSRLLTPPPETRRPDPSQPCEMPSVPTQEASWANGTRSAPSSSPLLAAAFLLAGQLPAFAPQAGGDAVFHPLAIRRDAISALCWADYYYPAGTDELSDHEAPDLVQSVQAATPAPLSTARAASPHPPTRWCSTLPSPCQTPRS